MRRLVVTVALVVVLLATIAGPVQVAGATGPGSALGGDTVSSIHGPAEFTENASESPEIVALYPDPIADVDAGEYVVLEAPTATNTTGWTLVDDAGAVASLPNTTVRGRVVLTTEPDSIEGDLGTTIRELEGTLPLANAGDSVALRRPSGTVVSQVSYDRAREGERYRQSADRWEWRVPGTTVFEPVETTPDGATAFVLPDAPEAVESELRDADERIYLAGYTLTSEGVVEALLEAHDRDVDVRVLLEGSPVGGTSQRQADALDGLAAADVPVTVLAGERDPFGVHHAKYAVIDDRALVLTENFKPAGTGGHSSRGWGAIVEGPDTADALADVFREDRTGPGAIDWGRHRDSVDPVPGGASSARYPTYFTPESVPIQRARLLVAPDNARTELETLLRSADDTIRIQQMSIDGMDDPLLQASIDAARNGTEVEILLSSASYAEGENRALAREIDRLAERENLPITASVVDPRGRFSKVHAKVAIVDDRHVVLGSLNWNEAAYEENREVIVVLTGPEVVAYYGTVFHADAREAPRWRVPTGLVGAVGALWGFLGLVAIVRIKWAA